MDKLIIGDGVTVSLNETNKNSTIENINNVKNLLDLGKKQRDYIKKLQLLFKISSVRI
jgi:hypothetical protein